MGLFRRPVGMTKHDGIILSRFDATEDIPIVGKHPEEFAPVLHHDRLGLVDIPILVHKRMFIMHEPCQTIKIVAVDTVIETLV